MEAVRSGNAFYQEKFRDISDAPLASWEEFIRRVPFTAKSEWVADQAAFPPYGRNLSFPLEHYTRLHQTSGTTGAPLRWLDTPESWSVVVGDWVEVLRHAGVTAGDRIFFAFSFGPFLGFWGAFEAAQQLGCLGIAGGGMSTTLRARVIFENQCTVLCCTPTYALHLAQQAAVEGWDLSASSIRLVVVAGEPGGSMPAVRNRLSQAWNGARIFDHHGMTEVGPVTYEDPAHPGNLVVLEQSHFVEVIDPVQLTPVGPGDTGELVLTTLRRLASPAIRYRTGDLVRAPRRLPSGPLVLEGGILGRVDDMVVVRGVNVYPTAIEQLVRSVLELGEYRVTVDASQPMLELQLEVEGSPTEAMELERRLRAQLGLRIPVQAVSPGTLPRFEMKAKRWRTVGAPV
jgi:phenylacetate-CoA ligase